MPPIRKHWGSTKGPRSLQKRLREQRNATGEASSSEDKLLQIAQLRSKVETESSETSISDMMLKKLPQELFDLIERYFYELTFVPGYLYPQGKPRYMGDDPTGTEILDWDRRSKARLSLLRLSKDIYFRYRERMYNENNIVLGSGQVAPRRNKRFHDVIPTRANIELVFGFRDFDLLKYVPGEGFGFREPGLAKCTPDVSTTRPDVSTAKKMCTAWDLKFLTFVRPSWPIDELTLDFRQCYDPDGKWLGYHLIELLDMIYAQKPNRITIRAPDMKKVEDLYRLLRFHGVSWHVHP
ncbi:MAG: hypothetical protein Q9226_008906 [Calogaya cf. arnoldii]